MAATPLIAAGALFFDGQGRVLLVKPSYKDGWEIPGGRVEADESPHAACVREIEEELALTVPVGSLLVVDWAPRDGDRILFVFDGGPLAEQPTEFPDGEITECRFVAPDDLDDYVLPRLSRRIRIAVAARSTGLPTYAEHGVPQP